MAHEQPHEAARAAGVDAEGLHWRRHRLPVALLQDLQRRYHTASAGEIGTAAIGAELAPPRIPTDDHARHNPKDDLRHHRGQEKADTGLFPLVLEQCPVDDTANDASEKDDEGI